MFIKYLEGLKPLKITANKKLGSDAIFHHERTEVIPLNTYKWGKGQLRCQWGTGKRWSSPKKAELQPTNVNQINSTVNSKQKFVVSELTHSVNKFTQNILMYIYSLC